MTTRRKLAITASLVAVALTVVLCWPKPKGYTYEGKTVEQWFGNYFKRGRENDAYFAFRDGIGTNAVPFLVDRITRDFKPSPTERLSSLLPARYQPASRTEQAHEAVYLLQHVIKPPEGMLRELLNPDLPIPNRHVISRLMTLPEMPPP